MPECCNEDCVCDCMHVKAGQAAACHVLQLQMCYCFFFYSCWAIMPLLSCMLTAQLTASGTAVLSGIDDHLNPLTCLSATCNSLTVDEHFAPFAGEYTEQPAQLQHLTIKYREHPRGRQTYGRDPLETLGNLTHLTQLRSLKVEIPGEMSGQPSLGNLPTSLTSLCVGG